NRSKRLPEGNNGGLLRNAFAQAWFRVERHRVFPGWNRRKPPVWNLGDDRPAEKRANVVGPNRVVEVVYEEREPETARQSYQGPRRDVEQGVVPGRQRDNPRWLNDADGLALARKEIEVLRAGLRRCERVGNALRQAQRAIGRV